MCAYSVRVPDDAKPGTYTIEVSVEDAPVPTESDPLKFKVTND